MNSPRLSVIVPLYNGLEFTRGMIASLERTIPTGLAHEIVLVDNGSTDGTREWLRSLHAPPFRTLLNETNLGYAAANNQGAAVARGKFLALLNNDLVLLPGWLEPMLELAESASVLVGNVQFSVRTRKIDHAGIFFDPSGKPFHFRPPLEFLGSGLVASAPAATGACLVLRRTLFAKLGGFDEGYRSGYEDVDLCLRARSKGHRTVIALRSAAYHYIGASEGRHDQESQNAARFQERWRDTAIGLSKVQPPIVPMDRPLEIPESAAATRDFATLQAFHPAPGGPSEQGSTVHLYRLARWTRLFVPLPRGLASGGATLRLDPCAFPGTVRVGPLVLRDRRSREILWSARGTALSEILTAAGTATLKSESSRWLTVESTGLDPQLHLRPESIPAIREQQGDPVLEVWLRTTASP